MLSCFSVHGVDDKSHQNLLLSPETVLQDLIQRTQSLRKERESLRQTMDRLNQHRSDRLKHGTQHDSVSGVEDAGQLVFSYIPISNWTSRQRQVRRYPLLRKSERLFLCSILGLRTGEIKVRLPSDVIQSVVMQWIPLSSGMMIHELMQCRDQRHQSFLNRKCDQEIKRQLSVCNRNRLDRITLCRVNHWRTLSFNSDRTVYLLHFFERKFQMDRFAAVDVAKEVVVARFLRTWHSGFSCTKWLYAHVPGQKYQSKTSEFVVLQFDFIETADKTVIVKVGWYPSEIEMKDVEMCTLGSLIEG